MLLDEKELKLRIESPLNLLNRLRSITNPHASIPSLPPKSAEIIDNLESKIAEGGIKTKAIGIMNAAMDELHKRMPEVQRPEKLASIAESMSKVVNNATSKNDNDNVRTPQIIIYAPQVLREEHFDIIDVGDG